MGAFQEKKVVARRVPARIIGALIAITLVVPALLLSTSPGALAVNPSYTAVAACTSVAGPSVLFQFSNLAPAGQSIGIDVYYRSGSTQYNYPANNIVIPPGGKLTASISVPYNREYSISVLELGEPMPGTTSVTVSGCTEPVPTWDGMIADGGSYNGYFVLRSNGSIDSFPSVYLNGDLTGVDVAHPIVGMARSSLFGSVERYWLASSAGNVYNPAYLGVHKAPFYGSLAGKTLPAPVVGITATPDGGGYWLFTSKGNVYNFGDGKFYGSLAGKVLPAPVVGMDTTPDGNGYWLVTSKGNVYNEGDAKFYGSLAGKVLPGPIVKIAASVDGLGYWLVTTKGNVYNEGDAKFYGSAANKALPGPITGMARTNDGAGYWLLTSKGNVYNYGDATFQGSPASS